jgi:4-diphosphocytidyl-2-C-methyl-D-erythritol kinase
VNDFEAPIFKEFPAIQSLKEGLYSAGAVYASMSGSGASVYGIFETPPKLPEGLKKKIAWQGHLVPVSCTL